MDQLEEIKSKIDIVAFISEYLPLKKAGRNFKANCPFHNEKTPSLIVSPERQIWKCFGCNLGGDVFGFLMQMERIEFGEALRILAKKTGVTLQSYQPAKGEAEKEKLFEINHLASEFFHYLLLNHPAGKKALTYILQRGISKESLEQFKIGYSPAMWDGLQKYMVGKKGYKSEDLEKAGLVISRHAPSANTQHLSPNTYYDRFRDRLMFPLYDHRGNVTGFSGRVLDPTIKEAKYVNTPETLAYHKSDLLYPLNITKEAIKKENCAMVVEGELDAISTYQTGIKNVVAIKGSALTEEQSKLLKRFCENVVLSLDADTAGDMASRRGIEIADKAGLNLKVLTLEKYKDPDEAAQKDPDYLKERYGKAENVYDFFIDSAFKRFRGTTAEEKKKIGQELVPTIAKIEDEIVKNVYIKKLAERLSVNEESIILQIEKGKHKSPDSITQNPPPKPVRERRETLEEYLLSLCFQSKKPEVLLIEENKFLLENPINLKLVKALEDFFVGNQKFYNQFFFKILPAELREVFDKLYLIDFGERVEDVGWVQKEVEKTKKQLEILTIKGEIAREVILVKKGDLEGMDESETQQKLLSLTQKLANLEKSR